MATKICKQCGELKPIEQYRKYYGGRKGTYRTCKMCERINARYKYLRSKGIQNEEYEKIQQLYEMQRQAGLQPPNIGAMRNKPLVESLDDMLSKFKSVIESVDAGVDAPPIPANLQIWLTKELTEEPDYYLDDIYEDLKDEYRPVLRIDKDMQPMYDDTYKDVLDRILERFYEYEEHYWDKEDNT